MKAVLDLISAWAVPLFLLGIPLYGWARGVKVYESFVEGAKEGFEVGVRIIPYLVAILAVVGAFRASGAMDALARLVAPVTAPVGLPAEVLPLVVVRPLSGGGATGVVGEIMNSLGPDSYAGRLASLIHGSSETTFYVLAVYFGAVGIHKIRHALWAGLIADLAGVVASVIIAGILWG